MAAMLLLLGHGALVNPVPRNALERVLPWSERAPAQPCICANTTAGSEHNPAGCEAVTWPRYIHRNSPSKIQVHGKIRISLKIPSIFLCLYSSHQVLVV